MALKDWKKRIDNELFIIWRNNKLKEEVTYIKKSKRLYIDDIEEGQRYAVRIKDKVFKTKTEALKYAKQYMRTH